MTADPVRAPNTVGKFTDLPLLTWYE